MRTLTPLRRNEEGAAALEFALVFPVVAFLILGLLYGLLAVAAHVSLAHATSRAVRYASIPLDTVTSTYPSVADVTAYVDEHTPFFTASTCDASVEGELRENAPVVLELGCDFPNPVGKALTTLRNLMAGRAETGDAHGSLRFVARAEGRRE